MTSITNEERNRREQLLFETHRERQLEALFSRESIVDVINDQSALCWSETTQVVKRLRDLLPFGRILAPSGFEVFLNRDLSRIVDAAQEQLLYWHLAGTTTQTTTRQNLYSCGTKTIISGSLQFLFTTTYSSIKFFKEKDFDIWSDSV